MLAKLCHNKLIYLSLSTFKPETNICIGEVKSSHGQKIVSHTSRFKVMLPYGLNGIEQRLTSFTSFCTPS